MIQRTTIRLDERLLANAKREARSEGRTLTAFIEDALRQLLARRRDRRAVKSEPFELPTFGGDGVRPGVDLDDSADLLDLMEQRA